jgi:hypothetical protein
VLEKANLPNRASDEQKFLEVITIPPGETMEIGPKSSQHESETGPLVCLNEVLLFSENKSAVLNYRGDQKDTSRDPTLEIMGIEFITDVIVRRNENGQLIGLNRFDYNLKKLKDRVLEGGVRLLVPGLIDQVKVISEDVKRFPEICWTASARYVIQLVPEQAKFQNECLRLGYMQIYCPAWFLPLTIVRLDLNVIVLT